MSIPFTTPRSSTGTGNTGSWRRARGVDQRLFEEGYSFDFFQAVCLLERMYPQRRPVGVHGAPSGEVVRFVAHQSLSFPPSSIFEVIPPDDEQGQPTMSVAFMGLTGPSGALPRHYTELLLRLTREAKTGGKLPLRDFLDLFNHRLISLFFRAWAKYRPHVAYGRGAYNWAQPDTFTTSLFSLVGLGLPGYRGRLSVTRWVRGSSGPRDLPLAKVNDAGLLYYAGLLAQRPRTACNLAALLGDFFGVKVEVRQFCGQWLHLEPEVQSRLGRRDGNCQLGFGAVAGQRVWDYQGKIRLRLGPLDYGRFIEFLPDCEPIAARKTFFLLSHLARLYAGAELDIDIQLVLRAEEVPPCRLEGDLPMGPRLGWNTWLVTESRTADADDPVFDARPLRRLDSGPVNVTNYSLV